MQEFDPVLKARALKTALGKSAAIKKLNLNAKLSPEERDLIVYNLSTYKAISEGKEISEFLKGQEWYVNSLCEFSALSAKERFLSEYDALVKEKVIDEVEGDDIFALIEEQM